MGTLQLTWATFRLELAQARRRRAFLILTVLAALSFLATVSLFGLNGSELPLAVVDEDHSQLAARFVQALGAVKHAFRVEPLSGEAAARGLQRGELIASLTLPAGFAAAVERGETVALPLDVDNLNLDLLADLQRALPTAILNFGQALGLPGLRVALREKDLQPGDTSFLQYVAVSALGLDAFLIAALLGALATAREWEAGTAKLLRLSPIGPLPVVLGKLGCAWLLACAALSAATALLLFGYRLMPVHPVGAGLALSLCAAAFGAFGVLLGALFRRALPIVPLIVGLSLPLYLDCGALEPTRFDGERLWQLAHLSPLYYAAGLLAWAFHGLAITPEPAWLLALALAIFGLLCAGLATRQLAWAPLR